MGETTVPVTGSSTLDKIGLAGGLSAADIAEARAALELSVPVKSKKPKITLTNYPKISSSTAATSLINKAFDSTLNRLPTSMEIKEFKPLLKAAQEKNYATSLYKTKGTVATKSTTSGLNEQEFLVSLITNNSKYTNELTAIKFTDPFLLQRKKEKTLYNEQIALAKGNPDKLLQLDTTSTYGRGLKDLRDAIETARLAAGAKLSKTEIDALAQEAYSKGLDRERNSLNTFLDNKFKFNVMDAKGKAGEQLADLQNVATANGLDLQKVFGSELPTWLESINKGESIDTFKKSIRSVAKIGMPQNVVNLLDQGINLNTIYSPYKNAMASVLELNPETLNLNDPILRSAITNDKEMSIYDFQKTLKQDPRWQYTDNAKADVSSSVQKVLKDFGFMG